MQSILTLLRTNIRTVVWGLVALCIIVTVLVFGNNIQRLFSSVDSTTLFASPATAGTIPAFQVMRHDGKSDWVPQVDYNANRTAQQSGDWNSSGTWSGGVIPREGDVVAIPPGISVTYGETTSVGLKAIGIHGTLTFKQDVNTRMKVGTILVYEDGFLTITPDDAHTAEVLFSERVNTTDDPSQMTAGLIGIGKVTVTGKALPRTFTKTVTAAAGASTVTLAEPLELRPGDRLYFADGRMDFPDTGELPAQGEFATVASAVGTTVTLSAPLNYVHSDSYMALLTRSVTFRSDLTGSRAHTIFLHYSEPNIQNVAFVDMGRTSNDPLNSVKFFTDGAPPYIGTNQIGRYPVHFHHVHNKFVFSGNAVVNEAASNQPRWSVTSHYSFGDIIGNVVIDPRGAGIVTEQGLETGLIEGNLVIGNGGGSDRFDPSSTLSCEQDEGHGGFGYWMRSRFTNVRNNVAAGVFLESGFFYNTFSICTDLNLPNIAGMPEDLRGKSQGSLPSGIREFSGNIADMPIYSGADPQFDGTFGVWGGSGDVTLSNYTVRLRGHRGSAISTDYQGTTYHLDNSKISGIPSIYQSGTSKTVGIHRDMVGNITNTRIENVNTAIDLSDAQARVINIQNNTLTAYTGILLESPADTVARPSRRLTTIDNVKFSPALSGKPQQNLHYKWTDIPGTSLESNLVPDMDVIVKNYNGVTGDNFQLFTNAQMSTAPVVGTSLTNSQAWSTYKRAMNGSTAASIPKPGLVGAFAGSILPLRSAEVVLLSPAQATEASYQLKYEYNTNVYPLTRRDGQIITESTNRTLTPGVNWLTVTLPNGARHYFAVTYGTGTGTPPPTGDTTVPTVSLTAPTTIAGTVAFTANASDNEAVTRVEFLVDGSVIATDTIAPYSTSWDSKTATNGTHTLLAKAYDAAGNVGQSNSVAATVSNSVSEPPPPSSDMQAPTVSITTPVDGSTVAKRSKLTITAAATDNVGVTQVQFLVNGTAKCTDTVAPYSCVVTVANKAGIAYSITAKSYDAAGNVGTSPLVTVTSR